MVLYRKPVYSAIQNLSESTALLLPFPVLMSLSNFSESSNFKPFEIIFLKHNAKLSARPKGARLFAAAKTVTLLGVRWSALLAYDNC